MADDGAGCGEESGETENWDPMQDHYDYGRVYAGAVGAVVNELVPEGEIQEKDMLCDFYAKRGICWKETCLKSHPENKAKVFDTITGEKIRFDSIAHYLQFDKLYQPQRLTTCHAKVQYIKSPWNFFCTPGRTDEFTCIHDISTVEEDLEVDMEEKVRKALTKYLLTGNLYATKSRSEYTEHQVVAVVRRNAEGRKYFCRGIVTSEDGNGLILDTGEKIRDKRGLVYLCDTGEFVDVPLLDIYSLDCTWTRVAPPLAIHTSLSGICPKGCTWSTTETEFFKSLVQNQNVLMRFVSVANPPPVGFYQVKPYEVDLLIRNKETKNYESVAKLMGENFEGIMQYLPMAPFYTPDIPK